MESQGDKLMQDMTEKRRAVLTAAIHTIASACRHIYEDEIEAAKKRMDVMESVRLKRAMQRDWDKWTAPLDEDLKALDAPPAVVEAITAEADGRGIGAPAPVEVLSAEQLEKRWPREA